MARTELPRKSDALELVLLAVSISGRSANHPKTTNAVSQLVRELAEVLRINPTWLQGQVNDWNEKVT